VTIIWLMNEQKRRAKGMLECWCGGLDLRPAGSSTLPTADTVQPPGRCRTWSWTPRGGSVPRPARN
jgi:hypothetical protein